MNEFETALAWAKFRAAGPVKVESGAPSPAGLRRLVETGAAGVWLLPNLPDGARPTVLDELGLAGVAVEQPNDTARALAACLRCCWPEPSGPIWPGVPVAWPHLLSVYQSITASRDEKVSHRALMGAVRRLASAGWLRFAEPTRTVQLGARVIGWSDAELGTLRELWRLIVLPAQSEGETA